MQSKRIAVIGAGISGLACAWRLAELQRRDRRDFEVLLFEAGVRPGGHIQTQKENGFILEKGPDSFISEKPAVLGLCENLGISSEIIGTENRHRRVFVAKNGRLVALPEGFYLIAPVDAVAFLRSPLFSAAGKIRMMLEPFVRRRASLADESIGGFIRRRFGREALERVGQPMLGGIYAGDPEHLSLAATLPRFRELEKNYGSVIRGLRNGALKKEKARQNFQGPRYGLFLSFREGMQTLTDAIASKLPAGCVRLNARIKEIFFMRRETGPSWRLTDEENQAEFFDALCLAVSARQARFLLAGAAPELAGALGKIPYQSVATLNLAYRTESIAHPLDGFGFIVPKSENRSMIACTFSGRKFKYRSPDGYTLLRVFVGGYAGKRYFEMDDESLKAAVHKDLSALLGIKKPALFSLLSRYPDSMPQYQMGHLDLVSQIRGRLNDHAGLYLTGSAYSGAGISDCVADAEAKAERIYEDLFPK